MKTTFYAVFNARGFVRAIKGAKGQQPALNGGERAVRMKVDIPDAAFRPEGIPTAAIEVPEDAMLSPMPGPIVTVQYPDDVSLRARPLQMGPDGAN